MQAAIEKTVLQSAKVIEDEIDAEIEKLESMDSDDLEKIRWALKRNKLDPFSALLCHST